MSSDLERRLARLEQHSAASRGIRIFTQDQDDPALYFEGEGEGARLWRRDEIAALGRQGWRVVLVEYVGASEWQAQRQADEPEE